MARKGKPDPVQPELPLGKAKKKWGGEREGAGRKKTGRARGLPHRARPFHDQHHPVHITLRVVSGLPSLRLDRVARVIGNAIRKAKTYYARTRPSFRVVHFSIQATHLHLIVEAGSKLTLSGGVRGLEIRLARTINRELNRGGRVFADRYHARALEKPREVRNAIVYVIQNWRHHVEGARGIDPCSSGRWFDGWAAPPPEQETRSPAASPVTWLLRTGWKRHGPAIRLAEGPVDSPP